MRQSEKFDVGGAVRSAIDVVTDGARGSGLGGWLEESRLRLLAIVGGIVSNHARGAGVDPPGDADLVAAFERELARRGRGEMSAAAAAGVIREQAADDHSALGGDRPSFVAAWGMAQDGGVTGSRIVLRAIEVLGEPAAGEVYCDAWDRASRQPAPLMTEEAALERWRSTMASQDADILAVGFVVKPWRGAELDRTMLAYGFFVALGFNPYAAARLALQVQPLVPR